VGISDFKGQNLIGIREYYEKDGEYLPGKKACPIALDVTENSLIFCSSRVSP
jgi:hypothetical protein